MSEQRSVATSSPASGVKTLPRSPAPNVQTNICTALYFRDPLPAGPVASSRNDQELLLQIPTQVDVDHGSGRLTPERCRGVGFPLERIMFKFRLLQLPLLLLALISQGSAQFAQTDHKRIVDAAGKPLFIRAANLGNWLVPEGYMWLFEGGPQSPGEIRPLVLELLGPEWPSAFCPKYRD